MTEKRPLLVLDGDSFAHGSNVPSDSVFDPAPWNFASNNNEIVAMITGLA
jgi:hypothetical protein